MKFTQKLAKWALSQLVDAANPRYTQRRPYDTTTVGPLHQEVTEWDRVQLESKSAKLYWNCGPAKGVVDDKATYSVGRAWLPIFRGEDKAFGDAARAWLVNQWYPLADISGKDFQTHLHLLSVSVDRDGGVFPLLTEYETGFPALQAVPSRMICSDGYEETVKSGPYRGLRIYDGIIVNKVGAPVAFKVKVSEGKWEYYSARDMENLFDPQTVDQLRGLPAFSHAILDLLNLRQVTEYEMLASALASSIGLIETNETGMPDPNDPMFALAPKRVYGEQQNGPITTAEMSGGMVKYFRANAGSKIDTFKSDRPGDAWQKLQDRLIRNACVGAGWPFEMAWDISALGGANTRLIIAKAMRAVEDRQDLLKPYAKRAVGYAVAKAIKQGLLPAPSNPEDWWKWDFTMPAKLTADYGRNKQADRDDYFAGLTTMTSILGEEGKSLDDHIAELANEQEKLRAAGLDPKTSKQLEDEDEEMPEADEEEEEADEEDATELRRQQHIEMLAALSNKPPQNITIAPPVVNVQMPDVSVNPRFDMPEPKVTVEAAQVHVSVPKQEAPSITVNVPEQAAPTIHVAASEAPIVNVAPPNVTVNVPPVNAQISLKRNKNGALESAKIES